MWTRLTGSMDGNSCTSKKSSIDICQKKNYYLKDNDVHSIRSEKKMNPPKRSSTFTSDSGQLKQRAQKSVMRLIHNGYGPKEISSELEDRISWRTLYRWGNGERTPKRRSDVIALEKLCQKLLKS